MTEHTFDFDFIAQKSDTTDPMICIMIDGVCYSENTSITSTNAAAPSTISIVVDLADGEHTIAVDFMNDDYTDQDYDRNVEWLETRLDGNQMRWRTMDFDGVSHTADIDTVETAGWWKFDITYEAAASFTFTTPYDWATV